MVKHKHEVLKITTGKLHTNDRNNFKAMSEMVQKEREESDPTKSAKLSELWKNNIEHNFEVEFWPFIRSNQTRTCVDIVMENSPLNLEKLIGATHLIYSAVSLVAII